MPAPKPAARSAEQDTVSVSRSDLDDLFAQALETLDNLQPVMEVRAGKVENDTERHPTETWANLEFVGVIQTKGRANGSTSIDTPPPINMPTAPQRGQQDHTSEPPPRRVAPSARSTPDRTAPSHDSLSDSAPTLSPPSPLFPRDVTPTSVPARAWATKPGGPDSTRHTGAHVEVTIGNGLGLWLGVTGLLLAAGVVAGLLIWAVAGG
ncbi:MAG: hypothetical protein AB8H79_22455 [Myxococcota bacterium]